MVSEDGIHFSNKEVAVSFEQYPEEYTCHIRDPKVWKNNGTYRMVLGGRLKGDHGSVLFYESEKERIEFETYINENREKFEERRKELDRKFIIDLADKTLDKGVYIERLRTGYVLSEMYKEWRLENSLKNI